MTGNANTEPAYATAAELKAAYPGYRHNFRAMAACGHYIMAGTDAVYVGEVADQRSAFADAAKVLPCTPGCPGATIANGTEKHPAARSS